jgi:nucleotide-binding universal stress UspA family protein
MRKKTERSENGMSERMKILIAYDGSECADAALDDMRRAGLPAVAEAILLTAADVFLPPPINEEVDNTFPLYVPDGVRRAHEHAAQAVSEASELAEGAAARVKTSFPDWKVSSEACADSPAWAVIKKADEIKADLVIVGAQGHNLLGGRLILGSVSQRVLYEASASVRVARYSKGSSNAPLRILIATDGSPDAEAAVEVVARRTWPAGSEARLLCVLDTVMAVTPSPGEPTVVKWVEVGDEEDWEWVRKLFEPSAEKLRKAGLKASVITRKGNPKNVVVEDAEGWGADSIFLGAKGMRGIDRFLLGSVSAAVSARAHCSVEVVRPKPSTREG